MATMKSAYQAAKRKYHAAGASYQKSHSPSAKKAYQAAKTEYHQIGKALADRGSR
jgi:hypothetical protein